MIDLVERLGRRKREAAEGLRRAGGEARDYPGRLGAILGGLARAGVDKLTLLFGESARELELPYARAAVAAGLVPVVGEPLGKKDRYGMDRVFLSISLRNEAHDVSQLAESGNTVIQWKTEDLAAEAGRVAAAFSDLRPNREPVSAEPLEPALRAEGFTLFAAPSHAQILRGAAGTLGKRSAESPSGWIAAHLALAEAGDFVALQGAAGAGELSRLQGRFRDATRIACTRGPVPLSNKGLYLQLGEPEACGPRALRIQVEDGPAGRAVEALSEAIRLITG